MNIALHHLLARQLRKYGIDAQHPPEGVAWPEFLSVIDQHYHDSDMDRGMLERALDISSKEMRALHQKQKSSYEARLKTIFSTIQDLIWLKDPNGVYLSCNPMFEHFCGSCEADVVGKTDFDFMDRELADSFRECDCETLDKGKPTINEKWAIFASNERRVCLETIRTPMFDESGQLIGVLGIARDISERKQSEIELKLAAAAFDANEGIIITDAQGVILRVNQAFTETTGYTSEEVVGQTPRLLKSGRHDKAFYDAMWDIVNKTGGWKGEIWDRRKNGEIFPKWLTITAIKDANGSVTHYVGTHTDITERKAAEDEIKLLAYFDPLTQLPNRRLLQDRLQQCLDSIARSGRQGALLFIDLDNFKTLNDTWGHAMGDMLLQQVAQRLKSCVRDGDTIARLGGDEFVVMLEDLSAHSLEAATQTEVVGKKILATLNQPYQLATREYHSSPSIGATLFSDDGRSREELLKHADIAMYQAKNSGRNALCFFDPKIQESINTRAFLEGDLRKALERQQFQLYYQVQVDSSFRPCGAEALIRWIHPERSMVSPAEFIPLAEETGLILPIGLWVLETACARLKEWEQDPLTRNLTLSVNVSVKQLRQPEFLAQVQDVVQRYAINPKLLKLELTESMLLENIKDTIATIIILKEIGVQFSLDDFGTGYSSLQYLKQLPLDQLKIDQSFVRDLSSSNNDRAIVRTIIAMAEILELGVIAEGVETEEQRQLLLNNGCTHYQGYLFSKPVPIEQFEMQLKYGYAPGSFDFSRQFATLF